LNISEYVLSEKGKRSFTDDEAPLVNFMEYQNISEMNRARMIDWMIQVFRVLKKSCAKTFFLAQYIMDEYFRANFRNQTKVDRT
jgi:hypothetical protein